MPTPNPYISCLRTVVPLIFLASLGPLSARAANPKPPKYPLRLHVLTIDERHPLPNITPGMGSVCGDSLLGASGGDIGGGDDGTPGDSSGGGGDDLCSPSTSMVFGPNPDYAGAGRADLVDPPSSTLGVSFTFSDCGQLRVPVGFHALPARWKKPGKKLEVLIPSNALPSKGRTPKPTKCTLGVVSHEFVYLLLGNGAMAEVAQDDYWKKPALRVFLSGGPRILQQRGDDQRRQTASPALQQRDPGQPVPTPPTP